MKQISWCFEEMLKIMNGKNLPELLDSNDKIIIAKNTLGKLINVAVTLDKIISDENFE